MSGTIISSPHVRTKKEYNSDEDDAAHEAWYNANAIHIAEHNAKGDTFQLGVAQCNDLSQEMYRTAAGLGFKASADRDGVTQNFGVHMYFDEEFADAIDRTTLGAVTPCWLFFHWRH